MAALSLVDIISSQQLPYPHPNKRSPSLRPTPIVIPRIIEPDLLTMPTLPLFPYSPPSPALSAMSSRSASGVSNGQFLLPSSQFLMAPSPSVYAESEEDMASDVESNMEADGDLDSGITAPVDSEHNDLLEQYIEKFDPENPQPVKSANSNPKVGGSVQRPFICKYNDCNRAFSRRADCVRHIKIHFNHRPWECQFCDKRFIQRHALVVHLRTHTGQRPYVCQCGKGFSESSSLTRHKRGHTNDRPYPCPENDCPKTFNRRSTLNRHLRVHNAGKADERDRRSSVSLSVNHETDGSFSPVSSTGGFSYSPVSVKREPFGDQLPSPEPSSENISSPSDGMATSDSEYDPHGQRSKGRIHKVQKRVHKKGDTSKGPGAVATAPPAIVISVTDHTEGGRANKGGVLDNSVAEAHGEEFHFDLDAILHGVDTQVQEKVDVHNYEDQLAGMSLEELTQLMGGMGDVAAQQMTTDANRNATTAAQWLENHIATTQMTSAMDLVQSGLLPVGFPMTQIGSNPVYLSNPTFTLTPVPFQQFTQHATTMHHAQRGRHLSFSHIPTGTPAHSQSDGSLTHPHHATRHLSLMPNSPVFAQAQQAAFLGQFQAMNGSVAPPARHTPSLALPQRPLHHNRVQSAPELHHLNIDIVRQVQAQMVAAAGNNTAQYIVPSNLFGNQPAQQQRRPSMGAAGGGGNLGLPMFTSPVTQNGVGWN